VAPAKVSVADFLSEWLPAQEPHLRASTLALYRTVASAYIVPRLGRETLQGLSPHRVGRFYAELLAKGGRGGRPLAAKTVRHAHIVLRRALDDAVQAGLVTRNVAALTKAPAVRRAEMRTWTAEQVGVFLAAASEHAPRLAAAFTVEVTTGLRRGELLGLRWSEVDLDAARAHVVRSLVIVDNKVCESEVKTNAGRRLVPLAPEAVAALREHRKHQLEERLQWGPAYRDLDLVFCREDGSPLHPERLIDAFARTTKAAGLSPIRFHDLRHTFATLGLQAGVPAKVMQEILGHSSIVVTLDTYSHAIPAMQEDATSKVAALIFGGSA
jgi:integrase